LWVGDWGNAQSGTSMPGGGGGGINDWPKAGETANAATTAQRPARMQNLPAPVVGTLPPNRGERNYRAGSPASQDFISRSTSASFD
jgi:hypothetical protein